VILIHQRHRQTDRRTTCNLNTALCTSASRGKNIDWVIGADNLNVVDADGVENEAKRRSLLFSVRPTTPALVVMVDRSYTTATRPYRMGEATPGGRASAAEKAFGLDEHGPGADHAAARSMTPKTHEADPATVRQTAGAGCRPFMNSDAYYAYGERTEHPAEKQELPSSQVERTQRRRCARPLLTDRSQRIARISVTTRNSCGLWIYLHYNSYWQNGLNSEEPQDSDVRRWRCFKLYGNANAECVIC